MKRREFLKAGLAAGVAGAVVPKVYGSLDNAIILSSTTRPRLMVSGDTITGLRSVATLKTDVTSGHSKTLYDAMKVIADAELTDDPIAGGDLQFGNVNDTCKRVLRQALMYLITENTSYRDNCINQLDSLFSTAPGDWPDWDSNTEYAFYLRHGMLCPDIALAYDWMYALLSSAQRSSIVDGLDTRGIQPFFTSVAAGENYLDTLDNFLPTMIGGMAIVGWSFGSDHAESQDLIDEAELAAKSPYPLSRMAQYKRVFESEGACNEGVGYFEGIAQDLARYEVCKFYYASVLADAAGTNGLASSPYPEMCKWQMYATRPPKNEILFGDGATEGQRNVLVGHVAAIASATGNEQLQWFYENNLTAPAANGDHRRLSYEVMYYDSSISKTSPEGVMPHGRAYKCPNDNFATSDMITTSRTDWGASTTACMVYGCGGPANSIHGHYEAGQICIDGHGEPLIIDYGSSSSAVARATLSHNVILIDGENQRVFQDRPMTKPHYAQFDDTRGGCWSYDMSPCYTYASQVRRTVVHLNPGIVAVVDEVTLDQSRNISLRWHMINAAAPGTGDKFTVVGDSGTELACQIIRLDAGSMTVSAQMNGSIPFNEATLTGSSCRILSLFSVFASSDTTDDWDLDGTTRYVDSPDGRVDVDVDSDKIIVRNRTTGYSWRAPLGAIAADFDGDGDVDFDDYSWFAQNWGT